MTARQYRVPVTQYLRPDGRRRRGTMPVSLTVYEMAQALRAAGWRIEMEVLTTGEVYTTMSRHGDEHLCSDLSDRGPGVSDGLEELIRRAYALYRGGGCEW